MKRCSSFTAFKFNCQYGGNTAVKELCGFADLQGSFFLFFSINKVYNKKNKMSTFEQNIFFEI